MKYFIFKGTRTKTAKQGKNLDKFMADNEHLADCEVSKPEYDAAKPAYKQTLQEQIDELRAEIEQLKNQ